MKVERTGTDRVSSGDSTAASRASATPFEGGLGLPVTVIRCLHQHPVRGVDYRPHGSRLGVAGGEWFPTGRIIERIRPDDLDTLDLDQDHQVGYCPKCRAATEYRKAAA